MNGTEASVSHLSSDTNHIFVGYEVVGRNFGGGIDIFDADDPTALGENRVTSVKSDQVDVQEVVDKDTTNGPEDIPPLFVTGAQAPPGPLVNTPSVTLKLLTSLSGMDVTTKRLTGNVAKSVEDIPPNVDSDGLKYRVFPATDDSTIRRFDEDLEDQFTQSVEFREWSSVTATSNGVFVLSKSGGIWKSSFSAGPQNQSPLLNVATLDRSGINENGITGLESSRPAGGCPLLFAALNAGGFRVLGSSADAVRLSRTSGNYTSATMPRGGQLLFASEKSGTTEVFEYDSNNQVFNSTPIKTTDFSSVSETSQINQVIRADDFVYVATSDGVLVLEVISEPSGNSGVKKAAKGRC